MSDGKEAIAELFLFVDVAAIMSQMPKPDVSGCEAV